MRVSAALAEDPSVEVVAVAEAVVVEVVAGALAVELEKRVLDGS